MHVGHLSGLGISKRELKEYRPFLEYAVHVGLRISKRELKAISTTTLSSSSRTLNLKERIESQVPEQRIVLGLCQESQREN